VVDVSYNMPRLVKHGKTPCDVCCDVQEEALVRGRKFPKPAFRSVQFVNWFFCARNPPH
jgi:hypothetical protein